MQLLNKISKYSIHSARLNSLNILVLSTLSILPELFKYPRRDYSIYLLMQLQELNSVHVELGNIHSIHPARIPPYISVRALSCNCLARQDKTPTSKIPI